MSETYAVARPPASVTFSFRIPALLVAATVLLMNVPLALGAGGTTFGPGDLASVLLVLAVGAEVIRRGTRLRRATAVLFSAVVIATSVVAVSAPDAGASVAGWLRYLQLFALVPAAVTLALRTRRDVLLVVHAMIVAALVQGLVGIFQVVTRTGASYGGQPIRAVGTFGATDVIAMSVVVGLAIVLAIGMAISAAPRARSIYLGIAAFLVIPLGFSLSRGSWIGTVAAVGLVLVFAGGRVLVTAAVAATALTVVVVGGMGAGSGVIADRITSIFSSPDSSIGDRDALRSTAVLIWLDHPATGVGLKAFPRYRDLYAPLNLNTTSDVEQAGLGFERQELLSPHNQYLLVLSEQGLVGLVPFLALVLGAAGAAVVATVRGRPEDRGPGAAIVGVSGWQLLQFYYGDLGGATSLLTSIILGLGLAWGLERERA